MAGDSSTKATIAGWSTPIRPASGTLDDFRVQIDGGRPFQPAAGGGATVAIVSGEQAAGKCRLAAERPVQCGPRAAVRSSVLWEYDIEGRPLADRLELSDPGQGPGRFPRDATTGRLPLLAGRTGGRAVAKDDRRAVSAGPGALPSHAGRVRLPLPGLDRFPRLAMSRKARPIYEPKTDGTRNPLVESGYVAVSPDLGEVLPNIPHPPSPYRELLGPRIMLDIWGHHQGTLPGRRREPAGLEGQRRRSRGDHLARLAALRLRRETARSSAGQSAVRRRRGDDRLRPRGQRVRLRLVAARELYRPVPRRPFLRSVGPRAAKRRLAVECLVQPKGRRCRASG